MNTKPNLLAGVALALSVAGAKGQQWSTNTLPLGLVAWWAAEGNATDTSGNLHDGTASGGVSYVASEYGSGFAFDGTGGVVEVSDSLGLRLTNALSIEFWAKRQRTGIDIVLEKGGDWNLGGEANYGVGLHSINNRMFYFFFRGGWRGTSGVADFNWHHYTVTATNGAANPSLYIDGVLRPIEWSEGAAALNLFPSSRALHLGAQLSPGWNYYGNNVLDDVRIYNRELGAAEISALYQGPPQPRLQIELTSLSSVTLRWASVAGKLYQLQSTTNLSSVTWDSEGSPVPGNGIVLSRSVPMGAASTRFFRLVLVEPPPNPDPEHLVWIAPGTFTMGSPDDEEGRMGWEGPQTVVTLTKGFWMVKHEVTQAEYLAVMGNNPSWFNGDRTSEGGANYGTELTRPVEQVSWNDAVAYCAQLTQRERAAGRIRTNCVYRLATEAEWEYACRGWTSTRFSYGDDPGYTNLTNYAWYGDNSGGTTHPVGQKLPNPLGLYDMHGNVWEWCQDWFGGYAGGIALDPQGPGTGSDRVIRGGCWVGWYGWGGPGRCRSASRDGGGPEYGGLSIGFRTVLAPGQP
jgi:formylglycine-generating enzyme required for sulfatase activity